MNCQDSKNAKTKWAADERELTRVDTVRGQKFSIIQALLSSVPPTNARYRPSGDGAPAVW